MPRPRWRWARHSRAWPRPRAASTWPPCARTTSRSWPPWRPSDTRRSARRRSSRGVHSPARAAIERAHPLEVDPEVHARTVIEPFVREIAVGSRPEGSVGGSQMGARSWAVRKQIGGEVEAHPEAEAVRLERRSRISFVPLVAAQVQRGREAGELFGPNRKRNVACEVRLERAVPRLIGQVALRSEACVEAPAFPIDAVVEVRSVARPVERGLALVARFPESQRRRGARAPPGESGAQVSCREAFSSGAVGLGATLAHADPCRVGRQRPERVLRGPRIEVPQRIERSGDDGLVAPSPGAIGTELVDVGLLRDSRQRQAERPATDDASGLEHAAVRLAEGVLLAAFAPCEERIDALVRSKGIDAGGSRPPERAFEAPREGFPRHACRG